MLGEGKGELIGVVGDLLVVDSLVVDLLVVLNTLVLNLLAVANTHPLAPHTTSHTSQEGNQTIRGATTTWRHDC